MQRILKAMMFCVIFAALDGCSIYKAATAPPPLELQNIRTGVNRINIVGTLGIPKSTETKADVRTDVYEFVHGSESATKGRIIFYIAGDLFTFGLAELLFWPLELGFGQGTEGRAVVTYGMDDISKSVLLVQKDGSPWEMAKVVEEKPVVVEKTRSKVNSVTGVITD